MNAEPMPMGTFAKLSLPGSTQSSFPGVQLYLPALLQSGPNAPEEPFLVELSNVPIASRENDGRIRRYDVDVRNRLMQLKLQQLINTLLSVSDPGCRPPGRTSGSTRVDRSAGSRTYWRGKFTGVCPVRVLRCSYPTGTLVSRMTTDERRSCDAGAGGISLALV
jgi:hypothetical protein